MPQPAKVKTKLETAAKEKVVGATKAEAQSAITPWRNIIEDPEATADLKAAATLRVRSLEAPPVLETAAYREAALASLTALAQANT